MYVFSTLRNTVNNTHRFHNWSRPELVLTQNGSGIFLDQELKYPITAAAILEFVTNSSNWDVLNKNVSNSTLDTVPTSPFSVDKVLKIMAESDGEILEFDDRFSKTSLVYGLTVNRCVTS